MCTESSPPIDLSGNVSEFFKGLVAEAIQRQAYEPTEAAESYVVALLTDFAKPGQLNEETLNRPVTLLLHEALESSGHERFEKLRVLGDGVLYVSGFFGDHLEIRGIEPEYVSTVGARAYAGASTMLVPTRAGRQSDVFAELAQKFSLFVGLVRDIAEKLYARGNSHRATVELYERWLRTGSTSLAQELSTRGVLPVRGSGVLH